MNDFLNGGGIAEPARARIAALGAASLAGYLFLARLSGPELAPANPEPGHIVFFLWTFAFLFALYAAAAAQCLAGRRLTRRDYALALGFALLFRMAMLPTDLILENDIYRYMWDGHMHHLGINPYRHAPGDPATRPFRTDYWPSINYPHVPTIYPPALQWVFAASEWLWPGNLVGMKTVLVFFDLGTLGVLAALLRKLELPREWVLLYAWSPLAVKEIANSGHADSASAFFLTLFLWCVLERRMAASAAVLALLTLTKFFGALLLPLMLWRWRARHYGIFGITIALCYLPYLRPDVNVFEGFLTFADGWQFNAGPYLWVQEAAAAAGLEASEASRWARRLMFAAVLAVTAWQTVRLRARREPMDLVRAILAVTGTLLMCSPVINAWYLVWMLPLLALRPNPAWLAFTGLACLSYTYYLYRDFPVWMKPVEFGGFFSILAAEWLWRRRTAREPENPPG